MTHDRELDLLLFGATGFTGGLVAEYLTGVARTRPLRWALAGRNAQKLAQARDRLASRLGSAPPPELVTVDAADTGALAAMARRTRVVITTVGPYGKYGEPTVRACAEQGTDYVDLTGEPEFVDLTRERYHARATETRARIVHACGFDSIPHDLGAYFTLKALRARMSPEERESTPITIEGFVRTRGTFSGGTLHSALEIMSHAPGRALRQRKQRPGKDARAHRVPLRIAYRPELGFYAVPLPTIDAEIVLRSAELLPEYGRDFHYGHYLGVKSAMQVAGLVAGAGSVFALAQLAPARALLRKIKDPGDGPDEETRAKGHFRVLFVGRAGAHEVQCEVRGGDPGYGETSKMLAESALCLAFDRARLPERYGVVPTAAAMGDALIERLQAAGIVFRELA